MSQGLEDVSGLLELAVEADDEDIFPDPMSRQLYTHWAGDHKAIERQFAALAPEPPKSSARSVA